MEDGSETAATSQGGFFSSFDVDTREPKFFFDIPGLGTFGVIDLYYSFWMYSFVILMLQASFNVAVAVVVYFCVVRPNYHPNNNSKQSAQPGESSAATSAQIYLVGYGLIIPFLILYVSMKAAVYLDTQNIALMMSFAGGAPAVLAFRCMEAMHKTLPPFASKSFYNFILYNASPVQFTFDAKTDEPVPLTRARFFNRNGKFVRNFIRTSILFSLLLPCNYRLFPETIWGQLFNNFVMAWLTASTAEAFITGLGLLTSLVSGIETEQFNDAPLTRSTSPRDFWSNRWNRITGLALRRSIYIPLMGEMKIKDEKMASQSDRQRRRRLAALATFCVSGLMHEYILYVMTLRGGTAVPESFAPSYGNQLLFFLWNGAFLVADQLFSKHPATVWMQRNLPRPVRTFLVLLVVMPVAHWFTDEYVGNGCFTDISFAFPRIVYMGRQYE